jgi:hypothetical protein
MKRLGWTTPIAALALVAAVTLGILALPETGEANCYLGETQTRWVGLGVVDCCYSESQYKYKDKQQERHRLPNCSWSSWQDTGVVRYYCFGLRGVCGMV